MDRKTEQKSDPYDLLLCYLGKRVVDSDYRSDGEYYEDLMERELDADGKELDDDAEDYVFSVYPSLTISVKKGRLIDIVLEVDVWKGEEAVEDAEPWIYWTKKDYIAAELFLRKITGTRGRLLVPSGLAPWHMRSDSFFLRFLPLLWMMTLLTCGYVPLGSRVQDVIFNLVVRFFIVLIVFVFSYSIPAELQSRSDVTNGTLLLWEPIILAVITLWANSKGFLY